MRLKIFLKSEQGVSLVELLVATSMMALALVAFYMLAVQTFGIWSKSDKRSDVQQTAQIAIDEMIREIRPASNNSNYPVIIEDDPPSIRFYSSNKIFVKYEHQTQAIVRRQTTGSITKENWLNNLVTWQESEVLADNVSALLFSPASYTFGASATSSFLIDVRVAVPSGRYSASGEEAMDLRTRVNLRNY